MCNDGQRQHRQHYTGQYSYFCYQCEKEFTTAGHYNEHMRGHDGRGFSCDYCGKILKSNKALRYYTWNILETTITECNKGFNDKAPFLKDKQSRLSLMYMCF